jgi:predicted SAM-dependent methyltransferase
VTGTLTLHRVYRRVRRMVAGPDPSPRDAGVAMRKAVSLMYVRGEGIEIGALHSPLPVAPGVRVRYVDRTGVGALRAHYYDLGHMTFAPVDVIDDGEKLTTFAEGSQDFIIANHFIEHTQDPIGTLRRFLAVLRTGGVLYLAVPDCRFTFDKDRPVTTFDHLARDHDEGPGWSYRNHVYEFSRLVHKFSGEQLEDHVRSIIRDSYSIHFHVWTHDAFLAMLLAAKKRYGMAFDLPVCMHNRPLGETICVLEKT